MFVGQTEVTGPQVSMYLLGFKNHYTPNKFITLYLNSFETYLVSQYPTEKFVDMTFSEDPNTDSDEEEENENDNNYKFNDDERFTISNSNKQINAVNL